jgi:hypothetical protein
MKLSVKQFNEKVVAISKLLDELTIDEARNILAETKIRIEECHIVNADKVEEFTNSLLDSSSEHHA